MRAAVIAPAIIVALAIPAHAIECQLSKGARGNHWAWREIDGRQCWYEGERGMAKSELHWPTSPNALAPRAAEPLPKSQLRSPRLLDAVAPRAAEPLPKSQLRSPRLPDAVAPPSTEPSPTSQLHSPTLPDAKAPPSTEPPPPHQTTLSYWKGNGDGKLIEAGTGIHVIRTDPPSISRAITFDGTPLATNAPWPSANTSFRSRWSAWEGKPNVMQLEADFSGQLK